jgi:hypothetical protein
MNCYLLVMTQKEFFENHVFEEILRERVNYYISKNQVIDFWISLQPKIIESLITSTSFKQTNFFKRTKEVSQYACLVSSNKEFINWIQLRLGYFEDIQNIAAEKKFYSDGILFSPSETLLKENKELLLSQSNTIDPTILYPKFLVVRNFFNKKNLL